MGIFGNSKFLMFVIKEIKIANFKSVQELSLPLSRFNVLIGSNGSGKSNILEAIAFGAAASGDKLDNEFLGSRGIRTSDSRLMKSAFSSELLSKPVKLEFGVEEETLSFTIEEEEKPILKWSVQEKKILEESIKSALISVYSEGFDDIKAKEFGFTEEVLQRQRTHSLQLQHLLRNGDNESLNKWVRAALGDLRFDELYKQGYYNELLANFIIYSPEISSLRKFEEESQIKPLGIKGEGLFNLLQIFNESYGAETINELKKYLNVIEWFDDFEAVSDRTTGRKNLVIKDRYIPDISLNQNNVNEGFLFLLFYISLIVSKETPSFFAIDNIEASFHPKLCKDLTENLIQLCNHHNKQLILTTHNPFVLDGLDLNDSNQSLFVVRRNSEGETIVDKIDKQPKNIKLSEAWMRGYIGGQPETID